MRVWSFRYAILTDNRSFNLTANDILELLEEEEEDDATDVADLVVHVTRFRLW